MLNKPFYTNSSAFIHVSGRFYYINFASSFFVLFHGAVSLQKKKKEKNLFVLPQVTGKSAFIKSC